MVQNLFLVRMRVFWKAVEVKAVTKVLMVILEKEKKNSSNGCSGDLHIYIYIYIIHI